MQIIASFLPKAIGFCLTLRRKDAKFFMGSLADAREKSKKY